MMKRIKKNLILKLHELFEKRKQAIVVCLVQLYNVSTPQMAPGYQNTNDIFESTSSKRMINEMWNLSFAVFIVLL